MKWQILSAKIGDEYSFRLKETRSIGNRCLQNGHFGAIHERAPQGQVSLVSRLRGRAVRRASRDSNRVWGAFVFHLQLVEVAPIHCVFRFIAGVNARIRAASRPKFRQLAREENPNLQMIVPMTEVVGLLQEGVGHLMREEIGRAHV